MDVIAFFGAVAVAVFAAVFWFGRSDAFTVRLSSSGARRKRGNPPKGFVDDCGDIARSKKIKSGEVRGVRTGQRIKLQFTKDIASHHQQAFRNAYALRSKN